ncbi:ParB N-terminal domain-containing protein [Mangrovicoccus algicola]|uniref:ParB N-terminal domain-containing protein n=1 Tax=Mangrovicoccus algicola TaxID=2771008 RepID=A0A8J6Z2C7_9RHOB|nr:ParB N-terminal domain-containing protein [Mangrovicoccus algicola]MBE3640371.1 ParB N-terminal domain-containing protein [Mangrovicoccus algicola]
MADRNKFGFDALDTGLPSKRRERSVGPMGAAVREAAQSLQETTEAKVEMRRRNAEDAKAFREAEAEGLVLRRLSIGDIRTDDLPRDRLELEAVASSDEMEELKASIRARGQREPIEVFADAQGRYQLKKGWRRLTALKQLYLETDDPAFAGVVARIDGAAAEDRVARYVDMVEENVIREDLTFAEMAQVALAAAADPSVPETDADALVARLYGSLHKMKRSYIRSFVYLLSELGPALQWPRSVTRNLGVEVARAMKAQPGRIASLRRALAAVGAQEDQAQVLADFIADRRRSDSGEARPKRERREKYEFHVGTTKVTARRGECRIVSGDDFADIPKDRLMRAIRAFEAALREEEGNPRVTSL